MRHRSPPLLLLASLTVAAVGCTVAGSGKGTPTWKSYTDEHPVTSTGFTLRSGPAEVRVHAVVVKESHTIFGPSSWTNVVNASVVNRGARPLRRTDLLTDDDFRIRTRSGEDTRAYVFTWGRDGWIDPQQNGQPVLPPGASGEILVQAKPNDGSRRDDPVAVSFRGQTVELR